VRFLGTRNWWHRAKNSMVISYAHMVFTEMPAILSEFLRQWLLKHVDCDLLPCGSSSGVAAYVHLYFLFGARMMNLICSCSFLGQWRMHYVIFQVSWVGKDHRV
jgi:hypothetical protein